MQVEFVKTTGIHSECDATRRAHSLNSKEKTYRLALPGVLSPLPLPAPPLSSSASARRLRKSERCTRPTVCSFRRSSAVWPDDANRGVGVDVLEGGLESAIVVADGTEVRTFDRHLGWMDGGVQIFRALKIELEAGCARIRSSAPQDVSACM